MLLCWLAVKPWIEWRTTHYVFTTHRVLIRRGVLRRTGRDISLQRISDVAFSQSLFKVTQLAPSRGEGFLRLLAKFEGLFIGRQAGFAQSGFRFALRFFL